MKHNRQSHDDDEEIGAIAGIALASVVAVILIALAVFLLRPDADELISRTEPATAHETRPSQ